MIKVILSLGRALNKTEQKTINGGNGPFRSGCPSDPHGCGYTGQSCNSNGDCEPNPIPGAPTSCDFGCCLNAY